jgi:hypothetical protein
MLDKDMSETCGMHYFEYEAAAKVDHTMPVSEFKQYYNEHCADCKYMCEICMYGEE